MANRPPCIIMLSFLRLNGLSYHNHNGPPCKKCVQTDMISMYGELPDPREATRIRLAQSIVAWWSNYEARRVRGRHNKEG